MEICCASGREMEMSAEGNSDILCNTTDENHFMEISVSEDDCPVTDKMHLSPMKKRIRITTSTPTYRKNIPSNPTPSSNPQAMEEFLESYNSADVDDVEIELPEIFNEKESVKPTLKSKHASALLKYSINIPYCVFSIHSGGFLNFIVTQ